MTPADAALVTLLAATLSANIAIPTLLWRSPRAAARIGAAALATLALLLAIVIALHNAGDPIPTLGLALAWLIYAAPTTAALLAARGHRAPAIALALTGALGIATGWLAARRFGAFGSQAPANWIEAALLTAVLAAIHAAWAAHRATPRTD